MSSFSRPCLPLASLLPMWSSSTCIVAASRPSSLMRIVSRTVIGGVPTQPMVRKRGKSFHNGYGICAKNSASSGNRPRCGSPSLPPPQTEALPSPDLSPAESSFGPPHWARAARVGSLGGHDFLPQSDGTLRCRQGATLYPQERRPEHDGTVRVLYAARIADCRSWTAAASTVKNMAPPPKNLVGSALSCIPCLSLRQKSRRLRALLPLPLIPSCGGIGHALSLAEPGYVGSAATWSPCKLHSFHH